ncbi:hypothetical protein PFX98_09025 [Paucibacter sediminis]|uniref:Uncharacterized protein n=1 Tax=Paucibacter sediminis TaxID=3019553 RepID=A0AA95SRW9_9BURK|nr:hypothetical protein [Paucibacter sp. S2-9]WIT13746.1 hypothetical protein PFX98_09025 [Paucibacter sp. S2-9]
MNIPSDNHKPQQPGAAAAEGAEAHTLASARRRRLIKLGAVSPVVLTAVSRPVHAVTGTCVNPSGFISVPTFNSRHPGALVCTSQGPTYWNGVASANKSLSPYKDMFRNVFGGTSNAKLYDVLASGSEFDRYCVAAYLNAWSGAAGFPITANQARAVWGTIMGVPLPSGLTAYPTASLGWDQAMTLIWLQSLMSA